MRISAVTKTAAVRTTITRCAPAATSAAVTTPMTASVITSAASISQVSAFGSAGRAAPRRFCRAAARWPSRATSSLPASRSRPPARTSSTPDPRMRAAQYVGTVLTRLSAIAGHSWRITLVA